MVLELFLPTESVYNMNFKNGIPFEDIDKYFEEFCVEEETDILQRAAEEYRKSLPRYPPNNNIDEVWNHLANKVVGHE
jgi:hypothetical protein